MSRDIKKYVDNLVEIKKRTSVISDHLIGKSTTNYKITDVEFLCLQFRKILELIALSSLVANKQEYSEHHKKFAKHYNARLILRDLKRINSDFYPKPTKQVIKIVDGKKVFDLEPVNEGFLAKEEFLDIYETCGGFMHAENPYGHKRNLEKTRAQFPIWLKKIIILLNHHNITLVDGETMIIGIMQGDKDGLPQVTEFKIVKGEEAEGFIRKIKKQKGV